MYWLAHHCERCNRAEPLCQIGLTRGVNSRCLYACMYVCRYIYIYKYMHMFWLAHHRECSRAESLCHILQCQPDTVNPGLTPCMHVCMKVYPYVYLSIGKACSPLQAPQPRWVPLSDSSQGQPEMCACMHTCMYACRYTYICISIFIGFLTTASAAAALSPSVRASASTRDGMHACMHVFMHVGVCICISTWWVKLGLKTSMSARWKMVYCRYVDRYRDSYMWVALCSPPRALQPRWAPRSDPASGSTPGGYNPAVNLDGCMHACMRTWVNPIYIHIPRGVTRDIFSYWLAHHCKRRSRAEPLGQI